MRKILLVMRLFDITGRYIFLARRKLFDDIMSNERWWLRRHLSGKKYSGPVRSWASPGRGRECVRRKERFSP